MADLENGATARGIVDLRLPSEYRLHAAADFSLVFAFRRVLRGEFFCLHYRSKTALEISEPGGARLGLVIGKKLAHRAVQRNLLKRLAREAFRLARQTLPPYDLVLRLAKPPGDGLDRLSRQALSADIKHLLIRLPR